RRSSMRLLAAINTITTMSNADRFCWCERFRSLVRKTSNSAEARASSWPLFLLSHPISGAVLTSWPTRSRFRRLGRHSSSRTRTGEERLLGLLQGRDGVFASAGGEILEDLRQGLARFEVVQQGLERHPSANEHRCATHDLRMAMN